MEEATSQVPQVILVVPGGGHLCEHLYVNIYTNTQCRVCEACDQMDRRGRRSTWTVTQIIQPNPHGSHTTHDLFRGEAERLLIRGCAAVAWGLRGDGVHFDWFLKLLWPLVTGWVILCWPIQHQPSYWGDSRCFIGKSFSFRIKEERDPKSILEMETVFPSAALPHSASMPAYSFHEVIKPPSSSPSWLARGYFLAIDSVFSAVTSECYL